jgi:hypothetical protein
VAVYEIVRVEGGFIKNFLIGWKPQQPVKFFIRELFNGGVVNN